MNIPYPAKIQQDWGECFVYNVLPGKICHSFHSLYYFYDYYPFLFLMLFQILYYTLDLSTPLIFHLSIFFFFSFFISPFSFFFFFHLSIFFFFSFFHLSIFFFFSFFISPLLLSWLSFVLLSLTVISICKFIFNLKEFSFHFLFTYWFFMHIYIHQILQDFLS